MAIYSAAARANRSNMDVNSTGAEIRVPADGATAYLMEIAASHNGASSTGDLLLFRSQFDASLDGNPTISTPFLPDEWTGFADGPCAVSRVLLITGWSSYPSCAIAASQSYVRRASRPNAVGTTVLWVFPRGVKMPPGTRMIFRGGTGTTTDADIWAIIEA